MPDAPYRFHAFDLSYFSAKVRPALRYKQLWYEELRADLAEIQQRTGMGFVPVIVTPRNETWQDSSEIYDHLEASHPSPPLFPATPVQRVAAHLVELYTDEFGILPAMHYRWGNELGVATTRARFGAMVGNREMGNAIAERMAAARIALGATDDTAAAIEAHTTELLASLDRLFASQPYLLGGRTSFADCALMGPLYAHLFNDLVPRRLLLETTVAVVGWIERTSFPNTDQQGEWLAGDALSPGFREALSVMGKDAVPLILDAVRAIESWADSRPADQAEPPRSIGFYETGLRGTRFQRAAIPYTLWMLQRTQAFYRGLGAGERRSVDAALAGSGFEEALAYEPRHRLAKKNFRLVFER